MDTAADHSNTRHGDLIVFFSAQWAVLGDCYSNDLEGSRGSGEHISDKIGQNAAYNRACRFMTSMFVRKHAA